MRNRIDDDAMRRLASLVLVIATTIATAQSSEAARNWGASAGVDWSRGPGDQETRDAVAGIGFGVGPAAIVTLGGMRYDDRAAGTGSGFTAGLAFPAEAPAQMRASVTRFLGDESFRAWRTQVGPRLQLPTGASLGVLWSRQRDETQAGSDGVVAELTVPLVPQWKGRASAGYAAATDGLAGAQGALGLAWSPAPGIELSGEMGLAQGGAPSGLAAPARRSPLPLIGGAQGNPGSAGSEGAHATALLGLRVWLP